MQQNKPQSGASSIPYCALAVLSLLLSSSPSPYLPNSFMKNIQSPQELLQQLPQILKTLESISKQYGEGTDENAAIEIAAKALFYLGTATEEEASIFIASFGQKLNEEQIMHLQKMGLNPKQG